MLAGCEPPSTSYILHPTSGIIAILNEAVQLCSHSLPASCCPSSSNCWCCLDVSLLLHPQPPSLLFRPQSSVGLRPQPCTGLHRPTQASVGLSTRVPRSQGLITDTGHRALNVAHCLWISKASCPFQKQLNCTFWVKESPAARSLRAQKQNCKISREDLVEN